MSDELKPCPWEKSGERHELEMVDVGALAWVRCATCMAAGPCENGRDKAVAAWNARAAVDDEQFSLAVHDGEAWQRVRTCRMVPVSLYDEEGVDGIECDECGWSDIHEWYDPMPEFCPNCGAKVVV